MADLARKAASDDPLFWAIVDRAAGEAQGYATLMRIEPVHRVIEVGNILFTPALQRKPGATEAMSLLAGHVFDDLGYRRYEWKCNALNAPSRAAALRLGFSFEGVFRQHMIIKGRNRDTAWYSMIDTEWPSVSRGFATWLAPDNFDSEGRQRRASQRSGTSRADGRHAHVAAPDPERPLSDLRRNSQFRRLALAVRRRRLTTLRRAPTPRSRVTAERCGQLKGRATWQDVWRVSGRC